MIQETHEHYTLALIDNAGMENQIQQRYGEFPFVCVGYDLNRNNSWTEPFPFDEATIIKNLSHQEEYKPFSLFISSSKRLKTFLQRHCAYTTYII